jgi:glutaryl-CoA dehydrogenase (non-decarboxylating)
MSMCGPTPTPGIRPSTRPPEIIAQMARHGYLGAVVPAEHGGTGSACITLGLLHGAMGQG